MSTFDSRLFAKLEDYRGYNKTNETEILNPYVNFYNHRNSQTLADALSAEAIQMRGIEFYFLPREYNNPDLLFGEDPSSKFTKAWKFAAYLDSFDGYSGDNTFFSKFGMMVNDEVNLTINPNLFKHQTNNSEPKAGDLIYFPMDNSLFEINWVQPYDPFYQLGQNVQRKITAQKYIYSGEQLQPELQRNEGIIIPEFSELDLEPIKNIDSLADISDVQYAESNEINKEAAEYVHPYYVNNGRGLESPPKADSFDDGFFE
jgi:hypothetical protein